MTDYSKRCSESAKASAHLLQKLSLSGLFNPKMWWDVFFIKSCSMMLSLSTFVDDRDFDPNQDALACLRVCMTILAKCGEFSPTMKNFATVATDLGTAMITTAGSPDSNRPSQENTCHGDGSLLIACPPMHLSQEIEFNSSVSETSPSMSSSEKFQADWESLDWDLVDWGHTEMSRPMIWNTSADL
jgi:hypothetical protein